MLKSLWARAASACSGSSESHWSVLAAHAISGVMTPLALLTSVIWTLAALALVEAFFL